MPNIGEKLTIAEFAARAGCTEQRVRQLLRKRLKPFHIIENGRNYVLSDGIQEVLNARQRQGYKAKNETVSERVSETLANSCKTVSDDDKQARIDELSAELDAIRAEIARTRADLEAAREQRQKAEIRAAAADAERKRADAAEQQCAAKDKRLEAMQAQIEDLQQRLHDIELKAAAADAELAAERHRADEQTAALTSALDAVKAAQEHAESLTQALAAAQALHAGQLRLAMSDDAENGSQSAEPVKRGLFARLFRRK